MHFEAGVIGTNLDFGSDPSCRHLLKMLRDTIANIPARTVGSGMIGPHAFFDSACTPLELDQIAPRNPVVLSMDSPHSGMLNQAAARKFNVRQNEPLRWQTSADMFIQAHKKG